MRDRWLVLLMIVPLLCACGVRAPATASDNAPPWQSASQGTPLAAPATTSALSPTPNAAGTLLDLGPLIQTTSGTVQASNRAAVVVLSVHTGDVITLNTPLQWESPPGVGLNPQYWLSLAVTLAGRKLFIYFEGGGQRFAAVDATHYRVVSDGNILLFAFDQSTRNGIATDHRSAIDGRGHLLLDPVPLPAALVVNYNTGEQLDVSDATAVGALATDQNSSVFTICAGVCTLSYQTSVARTFIAGVLSNCGPDLLVVSAEYRLRYHWINTGWLPPTQGTPMPPPCTPGKRLAAGDPVSDGFAHWIVSATTADGRPLSLAVAGDGTVYIGQIAVRFDCRSSPCRGD